MSYLLKCVLRFFRIGSYEDILVSERTLDSNADLRELKLRGNKIEALERASFQGLKDLYSLTLKGNAIAHISDDAFYQTTKLKILNLDDNRITSLGWVVRPPNKFALQMLIHIYLEGNQLTDLPEQPLTNIYNYHIFLLDKNPWRCSEKWTSLQRLNPEEFGAIKCSQLQTVTSPSPKSTKSGNSTVVGSPSSPAKDSSLSKTTATGIIVCVILLAVFGICGVIVFVVWHRKKMQRSEDTASRPVSDVAVRYAALM
ncbi:SLIT and NTRK-like protein 6 [Elysia marginata]|uniref:SLIT and NTRK-like protein 6 n=1 Tax=Elysia marginata TaxID=1093978 RepID=A0AAV4EAQ4_9GAST|nr:SLIT and NTRK-like protein 6 [Elysia marginata]